MPTLWRCKNSLPVQTPAVPPQTAAMISLIAVAHYKTSETHKISSETNGMFVFLKFVFWKSLYADTSVHYHCQINSMFPSRGTHFEHVVCWKPVQTHLHSSGVFPRCNPLFVKPKPLLHLLLQLLPEQARAHIAEAVDPEHRHTCESCEIYMDYPEHSNKWDVEKFMVYPENNKKWHVERSWPIRKHDQWVAPSASRQTGPCSRRWSSQSWTHQ